MDDRIYGFENTTKHKMTVYPDFGWEIMPDPDSGLESAAEGTPTPATAAAAAVIAAVVLPTVVVAVPSAAVTIAPRVFLATVAAVITTAAVRAARVGGPEAVPSSPLLPLLTPGGYFPML
jgi:hypothetical protein